MLLKIQQICYLQAQHSHITTQRFIYLTIHQPIIRNISTQYYSGSPFIPNKLPLHLTILRLANTQHAATHTRRHANTQTHDSAPVMLMQYCMQSTSPPNIIHPSLIHMLMFTHIYSCLFNHYIFTYFIFTLNNCIHLFS